MAETIQKETAATNAAAGMVRIQAQTMRPATPHLTADSLRVAPTPTIEPVIVCVVETGVPVSVTYASVNAAAVTAQKPPTGFNFVILVPIVRTMRQPPESVPSAIAACAASTTSIGIVGRVPFGPYCMPQTPPAVSTAVMMPIVFCASLPPCPNENAAADKSWPLRKILSTRLGVNRRKIQCI